MERSRQTPVRKRKLGAIERDVLQQLTVSDILYATLLSNRSSVRLNRLAHDRAAERYRRKRALKRLIDRKLVSMDGERLSITSAGQAALDEAIARTRSLLASAKWDGKWRIAAFDIPETHAPLRNKLRNTLKTAGFVRLQNSIWIFPHECEELVALLKNESFLSKCVLYGVLERIENSEELKKQFNLRGE